MRRKTCFLIALCLIMAISFSFSIPSIAMAQESTHVEKTSPLSADEQCQTEEMLFDGAFQIESAAISPVYTMSGKKVYWVKSGKVYHCTKKCRTLKRSKKIYSGTVKQAKKAGKKRKCKVCY